MSGRFAIVGFLLGACASPAAKYAMPEPFAPSGDAGRGREVFVSRDEGHCILCHGAPGVETFGNVGPSLAGIGSRFTVAELRLRVADITQVRPGAAMPTFHRTEAMVRVAPQYEGRPALSGQQVEDVVAWLATLK